MKLMLRLLRSLPSLKKNTFSSFTTADSDTDSESEVDTTLRLSQSKSKKLRKSSVKSFKKSKNPNNLQYASSPRTLLRRMLRPRKLLTTFTRSNPLSDRTWLKAFKLKKAVKSRRCSS